MEIRKSTLSAAAVVVIFILIVLIMISAFEKQMIYYPVKYPEGFWEPERFGVQIEDIWFTADDGVRLHGWYAAGNNSGPGLTLLWFHGNAGNITHRLENLRDLLELGIDVFIFDYRGYGKSEGEPSESGIYKDGIAAYDYLINEKGLASDKIVLFGRSLGTAVAVEVAIHREVRGIILESAFTDAKAMARIIIPFLPVGAMITSKFDSIGKMKNIHVPVLFTHGDSDSIVPIDLGKKLYQAANDPKDFYTIAGADHNDTYLVGGREYYQRIKHYLESLQ
jgi:uncharacterized protein